jgi:hypothetical protein
MASTVPVVFFGTVVHSPASTLRGGGLGVDGVVLAAAGTCVGVGTVDLDHADTGGLQVAGQPRAVGAGAFHADGLHAAVAA